ncbi:uncharacterized protein LOC141631182 [Silene latifolia]|uniref:uncharacterized protein LOC141631182 n=1 Tax=Silene latifolia TaxID=37657 RepID=UPI003D76B9D6
MTLRRNLGLIKRYRALLRSHHRCRGGGKIRSSAVFCYILGAKPPASVISGFVKRVWQSYGVDRISFLPNGIFLVRFKTKEKQMEVVNTGHLMFDNKPVIVKEWKPETELIKHDVQSIPIWVKLHGLDIKFWGTGHKLQQGCLSKIGGLVGKFIRCDEATSRRAFLGFARLLVEVQIGQDFPTEIVFLDELGKSQKVRVAYDWLPLTCEKCKGMGHSTDQCRKEGGQKPTKIWRPKPKPQQAAAGPRKQQTPVTKPVAQANSPRDQLVTPEPSVSVGVPVIVGKSPVVETQSLPRRFITKMLRQDSGEPRIFTPRGLSFMDALTVSMQKARNVSTGRRVIQVGFTDNGLYGLLETKIKGSQWIKVRNNICDNWSICTNNGYHPGGRIWLIWQPLMFDVDIQMVTYQLIHAQVFDKGNQKKMWVTMVYGFNKSQERVSLWHNLKVCEGLVHGPWIVCRDFNSVIDVNERIGGADVTWSEMAPMRDMMAQCQLHEIKTIGSYFTWNNKHESGSKVYSRLDRVLTNDDWLLSFPDSFANFLPEGLFDHCPCIISMADSGERKKTPFKYFNMWSLDENFLEVVNEGWQIPVHGTPMYQVMQKLKSVKRGLRQLNRANFSDIENLTHVTELSLKHFQGKLRVDPLNPELCQAERECSAELSTLVKARNLYLAQKCKEKWLDEGDDNTSFFHASIKRRRARNKIYQLKDKCGILCTQPEDIKIAFEEFYVGLLGNSKPVTQIHKGIVQAGKCLTAVHLAVLNAPLTDEEIKHAMFSIPGNKAPGPDGYSSQFFKDSWSIVGKDIIKAVKSAYESGKVLKECNNTILTLIPKIDNPESVLQFRPIACCTTLYKCLAKVICNREETL